MRIISRENINEFKSYLYAEERSKNTISKYIRDVKAFADFVGGAGITKDIVIEYKKGIIRRYKTASVNSMLSSLNAFFDFLSWHDLHIKTLKVQRQLFASRDVELTRDEYERLLKAAEKNERLCLLMQTICSCGIRVSELQYITVDSVKTGIANINCKGKLRVVLLPHKLCKMLRKYIKKNKIKDGSVFVSKNGKPLDRSNIWSMMKKLGEKANVAKEKIFPHNLRHLFARTFYKMQKDIVRLADILGHSNINTTRIYTAENIETHIAQIEKMHLLRC